MANRKSIYVGNELGTYVDTHLKEGYSVSALINTAVERYMMLLKTHRPRLSKNEWYLIFDSMNGLVTDEPAELAASGVWLSVRDSIDLDGLAQKWEVDGEALVQKIQAMTKAELLSIVDVVEQWRIDGYNEEVPRITKELFSEE